MAFECDYCTDSFLTEEELNAHKLLKHRDKLDNTDEFLSSVSDGYLEEHEVEKGEQFGYRKQT